MRLWESEFKCTGGRLNPRPSKLVSVYHKEAPGANPAFAMGSFFQAAYTAPGEEGQTNRNACPFAGAGAALPSCPATINIK